MLILVRHGESVLNAAGALVGRLDPDLTSRGERQAQAAGDLLGNVGELYSSPLARTRQTAALLNTGRDAVIEPRVIELDYGVFDGLPLSSIEPAIWNRWLTDADFTPEGGESLRSLTKRLTPFLEELFERDGYGARARDGDVVVVSHVSPIKAAVLWALGAEPLTTWKMHLTTGSITRIGFGAHGPHLLGFNEVPSTLED